MTLSLLVSKQTLSNDIQSLKKGIDLTKKERDKQPDNFVLFVSFLNGIDANAQTSFPVGGRCFPVKLNSFIFEFFVSDRQGN